jgi:hypothetical protein
MHDKACVVSQHNVQHLWFSQVPEIQSRCTPLPIIFLADGTVFGFFFVGESK